MSIKIGNASIDENGNIAGGKIGDQTGKEICVRLWYDKPWNVYLECTDKVIADKAAKFMEQICADNDYGYDQNERLTGYRSIVKGSLSIGKGEFDCSSLVSVCYKLAGLDINVANTTRSIRENFMATGKFKLYTDGAHLISDQMAKRGGIFLSEGHHVVMALENGTSKKSNPYTVPTTTVKFGETGTSVRWVQWELNYAGIAIKVSGEFDTATDKAVKAYQKSNGLEVDGKVGPITRAHFIND